MLLVLLGVGLICPPQGLMEFMPSLLYHLPSQSVWTREGSYYTVPQEPFGAKNCLPLVPSLSIRSSLLLRIIWVPGFTLLRTSSHVYKELKKSRGVILGGRPPKEFQRLP